MSLTYILNSVIGLFLNNFYWKQQQLLRWSLCTGFNSTLLHSSDTCEDLTQSSEVEESSLGHGEQLAQEHQKGDRGENHGEDHKDLHRLKPLWKKTSPNSGVTWLSKAAFYGGWFFVFVCFLFFSFCFSTSFFGGRTQPCFCEVVKPAVVPQVWVLQTAPLPPGLERKMRHNAWYSWHAFPDKYQVSNLITTFSMVDMNNIARVIRCSRITNISRYAIFNSLQKKKNPKKRFSEKSGFYCFYFVSKHKPKNRNHRTVFSVLDVHKQSGMCWPSHNNPTEKLNTDPADLCPSE